MPRSKSDMSLPVYEPREDTELLLQWIPKRVRKGARVLDMGTGSGALAAESAKIASSVLAVDVNPRAVEKAKAATTRLRNVRVLASDLFSRVPRTARFDFILFNPPYLPQDPGVVDPSLYGGKRGYEILVRFLREAPGYLAPEGEILVVYSSLTGPQRIITEIGASCLEMAILEEKKLFCEKLYIASVRRAPLCEALERAAYNSVRLLAKGKRGVVYRAERAGRAYAVKTENPRSRAVNRLENESFWLGVLNKKRIGPRLIAFSPAEGGVPVHLIMEFVEGLPILEFLSQASPTAAKRALASVLRQALALDRLGVNKEEMHWPVKHIIVCRGKAREGKGQPEPVLIDFERCRRTERPQNVTQFLQFLSARHVQDVLKEKGISLAREEILRQAKSYIPGERTSLSLLSALAAR